MMTHFAHVLGMGSGFCLLGYPRRKYSQYLAVALSSLDRDINKVCHSGNTHTRAQQSGKLSKKGLVLSPMLFGRSTVPVYRILQLSTANRLYLQIL